MNIEMASQAEADEEILTSDIPDAVLERAGSAEQTAFTLFYCTSQSSECGLRDWCILAQHLRQLRDIHGDSCK
jgi:hypothetical protein